MFRVSAALIAVLTTTPAVAQTRITPEAFLEVAEDKTLSFHDLESGLLVGKEQFLPRSLSVWKQDGEPCVYGQITTPHGRICSLYDDRPGRGPICWWLFQQGDRLMARYASFLGAQIQEVRTITTDPISCPNASAS